MDAVEEIKSRLNIEDVVSEYVQLKRAGSNWRGLSPFTNERTPSFMVSPEKGIWHDFSSGKGGNVFSFVMEMEGLDFKGALDLLARKANVDLSQYQGGQSAEIGRLRERLKEALEAASHFYQAQFKANKEALEYTLTKRRFTKETVLAFRLGYAPNNGSALVNHLQKKGFTERELQQAGLTARRYRGGMQDMFRGRLMIPLMDAQGQIIGFTARLLADDPNAPKYINTPQTILYDKGRHVFGLHAAKESIRREKYVVMVEGNLDVIASHQAGVAHVVATAGTALTEPHLKTLSRFTDDIRLSFDQDKAGITATERAIPIAGRVGVSLSIITIPEGKDPDELIRKDPQAWRDAIVKNQYALDWLLERYQHELDLTTAIGKRQFSDIVLKVVRQLSDEVEQDHYIEQIAKITSVSKEALTSKLHGIERSESRSQRNSKVRSAQVSLFDNSKNQDHFVCLLLLHPELRVQMADITSEMFLKTEARTVFEFLQQHPDFDGDAKILAKLKPVADYVKILGLQYEELYRNHENVDLMGEAIYLRLELIKKYVKTKKQDLAARMREVDETSATALLAQVHELDTLLRRTSRR